MTIKLYYFDARGKCEPIRWILYYGRIAFEDIRLPDAEFKVSGKNMSEEMQAKCRWGQMPLVEFDDGTSLMQSLAISRYFAKKCNLIPEDPYLAALCDEYVDAVRDYMNGFHPLIQMEEGFEKKQKLKEIMATSKSQFLDKFDLILSPTPDDIKGGKYLVGDSLTWADIWLAHSVDQFSRFLGVDLTAANENVRKLKDQVMGTEGIKEWVDKRPDTKW